MCLADDEPGQLRGRKVAFAGRDFVFLHRPQPRRSLFRGLDVTGRDSQGIYRVVRRRVALTSISGMATGALPS